MPKSSENSYKDVFNYYGHILLTADLVYTQDRMQDYRTGDQRDRKCISARRQPHQKSTLRNLKKIKVENIYYLNNKDI